MRASTRRSRWSQLRSRMLVARAGSSALRRRHWCRTVAASRHHRFAQRSDRKADPALLTSTSIGAGVKRGSDGGLDRGAIAHIELENGDRQPLAVPQPLRTAQVPHGRDDVVTVACEPLAVSRSKPLLRPVARTRDRQYLLVATTASPRLLEPATPRRRRLPSKRHVLRLLLGLQGRFRILGRRG